MNKLKQFISVFFLALVIAIIPFKICYSLEGQVYDEYISSKKQYLHGNILGDWFIGGKIEMMVCSRINGSWNAGDYGVVRDREGKYYWLQTSWGYRFQDDHARFSSTNMSDRMEYGGISLGHHKEEISKELAGNLIKCLKDITRSEGYSCVCDIKYKDDKIIGKYVDINFDAHLNYYYNFEYKVSESTYEKIKSEHTLTTSLDISHRFARDNSFSEYIEDSSVPQYQEAVVDYTGDYEFRLKGSDLKITSNSVKRVVDKTEVDLLFNNNSYYFTETNRNYTKPEDYCKFYRGFKASGKKPNSRVNLPLMTNGTHLASQYSLDRALYTLSENKLAFSTLTSDKQSIIIALDKSTNDIMPKDITLDIVNKKNGNKENYRLKDFNGNSISNVNVNNNLLRIAKSSESDEFDIYVNSSKNEVGDVNSERVFIGNTKDESDLVKYMHEHSVSETINKFKDFYSTAIKDVMNRYYKTYQEDTEKLWDVYKSLLGTDEDIFLAIGKEIETPYIKVSDTKALKEQNGEIKAYSVVRYGLPVDIEDILVL